jgi:hypothetical protein
MRILILLLPLLIITGCKKEMPEPPTEETSNSSGWGVMYNTYNVSFYTMSNGFGPIQIDLNGSTELITYFFNYNPGCRDPGCANFVVPSGTHSYKITRGSYYRVGSFTTGVSQCITIKI